MKQYIRILGRVVSLTDITHIHTEEQGGTHNLIVISAGVEQYFYCGEGIAGEKKAKEKLDSISAHLPFVGEDFQEVGFSPEVESSLRFAGLSLKERTLYNAGHPALKAYVKGEISFEQMLGGKAIILGASSYVSSGHEELVKVWTGKCPCVSEVKSSFSIPQLAKLNFEKTFSL
jgi:hypothetical protein